MAAVTPSPLDTANANSHILVNYLNMSDADWAAVGSDEKKKKWWVCIKIAKPAAVVGNVAGKLSTLLKVFANPLISRNGVLWMKHLLDGKVQCSACCSQNLTEGVLDCTVVSVGRHLRPHAGTPRHAAILAPNQRCCVRACLQLPYAHGQVR